MEQEAQVEGDISNGNQQATDISSEVKVQSRKPSSIYLHKNEPRLSDDPAFVRPGLLFIM
jgi:hypothetical protein